jgi:hypothetical protein
MYQVQSFSRAINRAIAYVKSRFICDPHLLRVTHQVMHGYFVSAPVAFPVVLTYRTIDGRVPVFVPIIHIWTTMVVEVLASSLHAIVKTLPLHFAKLGWRRIPALLNVTLSLWSSRVCLRWGKTYHARCDGQHCKSKPIESHYGPPFVLGHNDVAR